MGKKNILIWTLYDFANSIVEIVFFLYFAQWLVVDHGVSDLWYNLIFSIGSILLLVTAPIFGALADKRGTEQIYLRRITWLTFLCFSATALITLFFSGQVFLAALFFLLSNYFYQFSFVFYNSLLNYIAPHEKQGTVSGIGQAGNWLGQIVGLAISIPFASGAIYLFGHSGKAQTFSPVIILFILLSLPMMYWFKYQRNIEQKQAKISVWGEYKKQASELRTLLKSPGLGLFLLSYFLFNDAIITSANNFPIYMEQVFHSSDTTKSLLLIGILGTSVIGALISGIVTDKIGLRKALLIVLGGWIFIFPAMGLATYFPLFCLFAIIMGFLFGSIWTVTRTAMVELCPKDKLNFGFSFYTLAERVSTLVGPVSWGLITSLLVHYGPLRYRLAIISMSVFVFLGLLILRKLKFSGQNQI